MAWANLAEAFSAFAIMLVISFGLPSGLREELNNPAMRIESAE
jgi:hypothetical protein